MTTNQPTTSYYSEPGITTLAVRSPFHPLERPQQSGNLRRPCRLSIRGEPVPSSSGGTIETIRIPGACWHGFNVVGDERSCSSTSRQTLRLRGFERGATILRTDEIPLDWAQSRTDEGTHPRWRNRLSVAIQHLYGSETVRPSGERPVHHEVFEQLRPVPVFGETCPEVDPAYRRRGPIDSIEDRHGHDQRYA